MEKLRKVIVLMIEMTAVILIYRCSGQLNRPHVVFLRYVMQEHPRATVHLTLAGFNSHCGLAASPADPLETYMLVELIPSRHQTHNLQIHCNIENHRNPPGWIV